MTITLLRGDCRELLDGLEPASVQTIVTSPPYWHLRRYTDDDREIGQEPTPAAYVAALVDVFERCRRVLRDDGTLWLNLGDCYANDGKWGGSTGGKHADGLHGQEGPGRRRVTTGLPPKNLLGLPWRVAFALQDAGWILRMDCIWHKPNAMPESVTDRPTRSHEYVFLFSRNERYFYDATAIAEEATMKPQRRLAPQERKENGHAVDAWKNPRILRDRPMPDGDGTRNARSVWTIPTSPLPDEHYAPMPLALAERCIKAGSAAQACEVCGAPWSRMVEREKHPDRDIEVERAAAAAKTGRRDGAIPGPGGKIDIVYTTGWAPTCACPSAVGSSASVVLDPFGGSGTTGRAALALQRRAVLIDLAYTDLQERRTDGVQVEMVELL